MKGSVSARVVDDPIRLEDLVSGQLGAGHGARVLFLGTVRDWNNGKSVVAVSYDAFRPLAETVFRKICLEAQEKWGPDLGIVLVHRVGRLGVGEVSVVIAVASVHRGEAYQASRYLIEEIKHRAPIWKKEHYDDGETEWLKGHALCRGGDAATGGQ